MAEERKHGWKRGRGTIVRTIAFMPDQLPRLAAAGARVRMSRSELVRAAIEELLARFERPLLEPTTRSGAEATGG